MTTHETPMGPLVLAASDAGITLVAPAGGRVTSPPETPAAKEILKNAQRELDAYFAGDLHEFTVPVDLSATNQRDQQILNALGSVTFGETTSYGQLAKDVDMPDIDAQRIGATMARNPVLVIVPCHRVVGADGSLTGYAGGLRAKRFLLDLEAATHRPMLDLGFQKDLVQLTRARRR
jgi:methylated-DNA-[protein]-cysteine S-methyltransferase